MREEIKGYNVESSRTQLASGTWNDTNVMNRTIRIDTTSARNTRHDNNMYEAAITMVDRVTRIFMLLVIDMPRLSVC